MASNAEKSLTVKTSGYVSSNAFPSRASSTECRQRRIAKVFISRDFQNLPKSISLSTNKIMPR